MEDSCPATPLVLTGRDSKSPLQVAISSPESDGMKSPSRDSPDSRCVICLGRLQNKSFTDSCLHQFCFQCLLQWSKVNFLQIKPECPLCKQPFKSIIHNVRSNLDYDQYHVEHGEPRYVLSDLMHSYNFDLIPVDRRFRYRSTMTREYFRELAESFLAHTRRLPEDPYQISPLVPVDPAPTHGVRRSNRLHAHSAHQRTRQRGTSDFRRNVYAQDLWVQDLADISGRYRECTPQFYRDNPAQIHRIIPWLNREVNVLLSDCQSHAAYVLSRIVSLLSQHHIKSREFREVIQLYFGDRTDHFIHELYTFAHSVYDIAGFDQNAVYGTNPNYATVVQEISSSSDDSDIEVLETVNVEERKSSQGFKKFLLKRAGETERGAEPVAGPSGVSAAPAVGGASESIDICESDADDVKVVDYIKPQPEVVTLSSSDENPQFSDLDLSNGEYAEVISSEADKIPDRDEDHVPPCERRKNKYKTGKGKCRSNGFGLKGKQKNKYLKSRRHRSSSSSSSSSSSESRSSSSSSVGSRSRSRSSSRSSSSTAMSRSSSTGKSRSISVSSNSCDYKTVKVKRKKSKVFRKKSKKKSNSKSHNRRHKSGSDGERGGRSRKKVKSCVIVPSWSNETPNKSSDERNHCKTRDRYWSIVTSETPRKRRDSTERKSKTKRKHRECYSGAERSRKRSRDSSSDHSANSDNKYSKILSRKIKVGNSSEVGETSGQECATASLATHLSNSQSAIKLSPRTNSD